MAHNLKLVLIVILPFVQCAHRTTHESTTGGMIRLPWETQRNANSPHTVHSSHGDSIHNRMIRDPIPISNPSLGETIAAVSPSEVRTLSDNTDVTQTSVDPQIDFPRRHWRRRRPQLWRNPDAMPALLPDIPGSNQGLDTSPRVQNHKDQGLHSDKGPPQLIQAQKLISSILPGLDIRNGRQNNEKHSTVSNQQKSQEKSGLDKKAMSGGQHSGGLLKGLLQKITEKVASTIVDKLVDRVIQNNQMQSDVLPGNTPSSLNGAQTHFDRIQNNPMQSVGLLGNTPSSSASGRGFGNTFTPNSHVHGANGEVIPIVHHGDHIHTPHGQTIRVNNPRTRNFGRMGHRSSWNQNPFLHRSVRNSPRGWAFG